MIQKKMFYYLGTYICLARASHRPPGGIISDPLPLSARKAVFVDETTLSATKSIFVQSAKQRGGKNELCVFYTRARAVDLFYKHSDVLLD